MDESEIVIATGEPDRHPTPAKWRAVSARTLAAPADERSEEMREARRLSRGATGSSAGAGWKIPADSKSSCSWEAPRGGEKSSVSPVEAARSAANSARRDSQRRVEGAREADGADESDGTNGSDGADEWEYLVLCRGAAGVAISGAGSALAATPLGSCWSERALEEAGAAKRRPRRRRLEAARVRRVGSAAVLLVLVSESVTPGRTEKETMRACWS